MNETAKSISKATRRLGVIVNYIALAVFLVLFLAMEDHKWDWMIGTGIVLSLAVFTWTFIIIHVKTGLWKFVHTRFDRLDEREAQVNYESLRYAYRIFAVVCLVIIYINAVVEKGHIHVIIAASLLYLAHTLPSAVIAWKEREV